MNNQEINETIAKACGWVYTEPGEAHRKGRPWPELCWKEPDLPRKGLNSWQGLGSYLEEPPDYVNDLNAMHKAEAALGGAQQVNYRAELIRVTRSKLKFHRATAAQRAEAFLGVLANSDIR